MLTDLFSDKEMPDLTGRFTMQEQIRCVEREIAMRKSAYPKFVERGRMKPAEADVELACMEQVLRTLRSLVNDGK